MATMATDGYGVYRVYHLGGVLLRARRKHIASFVYNISYELVYQKIPISHSRAPKLLLPHSFEPQDSSHKSGTDTGSETFGVYRRLTMSYCPIPCVMGVTCATCVRLGVLPGGGWGCKTRWPRVYYDTSI